MLGYVSCVKVESHFDWSKAVSHSTVVESVIGISTGCVVSSLGKVMFEQLVLPVVLRVHACLSTSGLFCHDTEILVEILRAVTFDTAGRVLVARDGSTEQAENDAQE